MLRFCSAVFSAIAGSLVTCLVWHINTAPNHGNDGLTAALFIGAALSAALALGCGVEEHY